MLWPASTDKLLLDRAVVDLGVGRGRVEEKTAAAGRHVGKDVPSAEIGGGLDAESFAELVSETEFEKAGRREFDGFERWLACWREAGLFDADLGFSAEVAAVPRAISENIEAETAVRNVSEKRACAEQTAEARAFEDDGLD